MGPKTRVDPSTDFKTPQSGVLPTANHDGKGIDPQHSEPLKKGQKNTDLISGKIKSTADKAHDKQTKFSDNDADHKNKFDATKTELGKDGDIKNPSGSSAKTTGATSPDSNKPDYNSNMPKEQNQPQTSAPTAPTGAAPSSGSGGGTPSTMNGQGSPAAQHQISNDDLLKELKKEIGEGKYSSKGSDLHQKAKEGSTADRFHKAAQEKVDSKLMYAWAGGHGATPGPSQGERDGGVADSFGDYNIVGEDCSGTYRSVTFNATGIDIGAGTAADIFNSGREVSAADARPGDAYFPVSAGRPPKHIQMNMGGGQVYEAACSGTPVRFSNLVPGGTFIRTIPDEIINDDQQEQYYDAA